MDFKKLVEILNADLEKRGKSDDSDEKSSKKDILEESKQIEQLPKEVPVFKEDVVKDNKFDIETEKTDPPSKKTDDKKKLLTKDDLTEDQKAALDYISQFLKSYIKGSLFLGDHKYRFS